MRAFTEATAALCVGASVIIGSTLLVFLSTNNIINKPALNNINSASHLRVQRKRRQLLSGGANNATSATATQRHLLANNLQACPSNLNRPGPQLPAIPDLFMSPTYAASFPGLGDKLFTHYLIENITGIRVGEASVSPSVERMKAQYMDRTGFARGQTEVVALRTNYPHTGELSPWDLFLQRAVVILRNPLSAIPSYFDYLYEKNIHMTASSSVGSSAEKLEETRAAWIKWRDNQFSDQVLLYRRFVSVWMEKYLDHDNERIFLTYEDLVDEEAGPQAATRLANFFVHGIQASAMENHVEFSTEAIATFADINDIPCIWKHIVYDSINNSNGQRKGDWLQTERPLTPENLAETANMLLELINRWTGHEIILSILAGYRQEILNLMESGGQKSEQLTEQQTDGASSASSVAIVPEVALADATTDDSSNLYDDYITTESGMKYIITKEGDGPIPTAGQIVDAHYTGWLDSFDSKNKFDSSRDRGRSFQFKLSAGQVIRGWDESFSTMKVGERRNIILPSALAYGAQGAGGVIPPDATLYFDVELLGIG